MKENAMIEKIRSYVPYNEQEEKDRSILLWTLTHHGKECFSRENLAMHFSASAWITDESREKVLMAYHSLYDAWAWTGGHADGETDLLSVAIREAYEETGVTARALSSDIFSIEVLNVDGHEKRGQYVPTHLHLNVTYLLEADSRAPLRVKEDENKAVRWFTLEEALENCSEPWMVQRIYSKLNEKLRRFIKE